MDVLFMLNKLVITLLFQAFYLLEEDIKFMQIWRQKFICI